jgi:protein SCO1/2
VKRTAVGFAWAVATWAGAACAPRPAGQRHELKGQVLAINAKRLEIVIRHQDIPGFMPAMTMPFAVKDEALLDGRAPGDLVDGTLVVTDTSAWLERLTKTGVATLTEPMAVAEPGALSPNEPVPDAAFVDQDGRARHFAEWRGSAVAVTFIFTRCPLPDFCPALDRSFARVAGLVRAEPALAAKVRLLTVSLDPAYDTPAVLKNHAARLGADPTLWVYLTGEVAAVDAFGRHFGLSVARDGDEGGLTHNLRTAVVDPAGRLVRTWRGSDFAPEDVAGELRKAALGR